jgi:hypothetical protein
MLDRDGAESPRRGPGARPGRDRGMRRRALLGCAALALALHAIFIASVGGVVSGPSETTTAPMSVRTVPGPPAQEARQEPPKAPADVDVAGLPRSDAPVQISARPRPPASSTVASHARVKNAIEASANLPRVPAAPGSVASVDLSSAVSDADTALTTPATPASGVAAVGDATAPARARDRPADGQPLLAAGDEPPPVYRTQLPPPVTLHYQLRRGSLAGTAQIHWQPGGDSYRLVLEAQVAGIAL